MRKTREDVIFDAVNYFLLSLIAFAALYPFYYVLLASFNEGYNTAKGGMYLWPRAFTLNNYAFFLRDPRWTNAFLISVARTVLGTVLGVLFTSLVAYGLSKPYLMLRRFYFTLVVISMNVSGGLITYYVVLRGIGLINTFAVYIIPPMLNLFFLLIAVSFFRTLPEELSESARMDGASELTIFARIIIPVSRPLLATMSLFLGAAQWNSWVDSAYFVQSQGLRTLAYRMIAVINQTMVPADAQTAHFMVSLHITTFSVLATAMVVSVVPILCVYPFLQRYFVQGMMLGSMKG